MGTVTFLDHRTVAGRPAPTGEGVEELTLDSLNEATQAWVEREYHRTLHSELGCTPLERYLQGPEVRRESPGSEELRRAFRIETSRAQRRTDGTISLAGGRFEIPSRYRHLQRVRIRYARWDLATCDLIDAHSGAILCALYPLDKAANAAGLRRRLDPLTSEPSDTTASGIAPWLAKTHGRLRRHRPPTGLSAHPAL